MKFNQNSNSIASRLQELLEDFSSFLTINDYEQIQELIHANEIGIAFENFCTQLFEREATCSINQLHLISEIGKEIGMSPRYWTELENRPILIPPINSNPSFDAQDEN